MSFFSDNDDWESTNIPRISDLTQEEETKKYLISEWISGAESFLLLGMKSDESLNSLRVTQSTQPFVWRNDSTTEGPLYLHELEDGVQYTFKSRTEELDDSIYTVVSRKKVDTTSREVDMSYFLHKINIDSANIEEVSFPQSIQKSGATPVFINENMGYLLPSSRSVFFETHDGGNNWAERHLPPGYARLKGIDRYYSGNYAIHPTSKDLFLSGHFDGDDDQPGSSPIYRLPSDNDDVQGWQEVARLEGYDINAMTFLENGDLLILAYEGDRPEEGSDFRQAQILRWDGEEFEHLADLGSRRLFSPRTNTNLSSNYFVTGQDGLVVINGTSFKNENGDLPVYNITYVSHDYGRTWERLDNGTATGSVWFDQESGYLYKTTPFSSYRKRL